MKLLKHLRPFGGIIVVSCMLDVVCGTFLTAVVSHFHLTQPTGVFSFQAVYYVFAIFGMMLFDGVTNPSVVGANKTR